MSEVFLLNIAGINPKVNKQRIKLKTLGELIKESDNMIPFFVLCETHLKEQILDAEVSIPEYNLLRADRSVRKNGGVAIYYHHTFSISDSESVSVSVRWPTTKKTT